MSCRAPPDAVKLPMINRAVHTFCKMHLSKVFQYIYHASYYGIATTVCESAFQILFLHPTVYIECFIERGQCTHPEPCLIGYNII